MQNLVLTVSLFVNLQRAPQNTSDYNFVQMSIFENECEYVDTDMDFGSLPAEEQSKHTSFQSFCEGVGNYRILKEGTADKFKVSLDYLNTEIKLKTKKDSMSYGQNIAWVFSPDDDSKVTPIALIYSTYAEVLIDKKNNIWEPQETYVVVALDGAKSCVIAQIDVEDDGESSWLETLDIASEAPDTPCM